jgi:hypothetical protein
MVAAASRPEPLLACLFRRPGCEPKPVSFLRFPAADIEPGEGVLRITLAPLSSPHQSRAVESLCAALNKTNTMFPGTQLQMRFAVAQPRS